LDVAEQLADRVAELEEQANELLRENMELSALASENIQEAVFDEVSEGLTTIQADRLRSLTEDLEFDGDVDSYSKKLNIIKDKFLKVPGKTTDTLNESTDDDTTEEEYASPSVDKYVKAISETVRK